MFLLDLASTESGPEPNKKYITKRNNTMAESSNDCPTAASPSFRWRKNTAKNKIGNCKNAANRV